jgi:hypothetical protein
MPIPTNRRRCRSRGAEVCASVRRRVAVTRASSGMRSPKRRRRRRLFESRRGSIRTRDPCRVLIRRTSLRYLRRISASAQVPEPACLQAVSPLFECSEHLPENRGVPGSSPGLAIKIGPAERGLLWARRTSSASALRRRAGGRPSAKRPRSSTSSARCPSCRPWRRVAGAQPKKSAAPLFRRMLSSHEQSLGRARTAGEPAGQIAARELEVQRISGALRRADALDHDVARAIEAA